MATLKTTDAELALFVPSDIYRFDVDNRPLRNLLDNDIALNTELVAVREEVEDARTGLTVVYPTLDARLDDLELAAGYPQKQVAYNEFIARSEAFAARYASGFIKPVENVLKLSDMFISHNVGPAGVYPPNGHFSNPGFGDLLLHDLTSAVGVNRIIFGNGIGPRFASGSGVYDFANYRPLDAFVNGLHVRLFNETTLGTTGRANEVTWGLPDAPTTGYRIDVLWLEVWLQNIPRSTPTFYEYGAVGSKAATLSSADHPSLVGNVGFWGGNNGDYFQLRHRLRVTTNVNPDLHPFGLSDAVVLAQGGNSSIMGAGAYSGFISSTKTSRRDPGLWIAGDGSAASKAAQNTLDGYVYAVPVALVFRRNKAQYTVTNQNGTATSGGTGSWLTPNSGRPDNYYHDKIEAGDVVLIAPSQVSERNNLPMILEKTFDRLLRGTLGTKHGFLKYDQQYDESGFNTPHNGVGGALIPITGVISATDEANVAQIKDQPPVVDGDVWYLTLNVMPDDFRRTYSAQPEFQYTGFTIDVQANAGSPNNLVSKAGNIITLKATGYSTGAIFASIEESPILWWSGSKKPVVMDGGWTSTGPETWSATLNTADANYSATGTIVGIVKIKFPTTLGVKKANTVTVSQTYQNPSSVQTPLSFIKNAGTTPLLSPTSVAYDATYLYVTDKLAAQVYKISRATKQVIATFGVFATIKTDNTGLNGPSHVTVDGSGNVYVADTLNHRVIKLDSSLAYVGQFGITGAAGTDNTHLSQPMGIAIDGAGNLYISDTLNYRIMKVSSTFTFIDQYGVTGVSSPDATHCVSPHHLFYASDSLLYVADVTRVIIINPNTMVPTTFIKNGSSTPSAQTTSVRSIHPDAIIRIREDSVGNKYVLHVDYYPYPDKPGYLLTKYDSSWGYVGRYGSRYDVNGQNGGINAGTANGLIWGIDLMLDEANDAIVYVEQMEASRGSVSGGHEINMFVIKMSDLTLIKKISAPYTGTTIRPYGPIYAKRPSAGYTTPPQTANHPRFNPSCLEFDPVNRYVYVLMSGTPTEPEPTNDSYVRVEKWYAPSADPDTWVYQERFGEGQYLYSGGQYKWANWFSASHNNSRFLNLVTYGNGSYLNEQGDFLYILDNHTLVKLNTSTMTIVGRFGTPGIPGNDNSSLTFINWGPSYTRDLLASMEGTLINEADTNGRIYILDPGNKRVVILRKDLTFVTSFTHFTITEVPSPLLGRSFDRTKLWGKSTAAALPGAIEFDITGALRDAPSFVDPSSGSYFNVYVPWFDFLPEDYQSRVTGITVNDGILYIADSGINQLAAITTQHFQFLGKCGGLVANNDPDGWSRPHGIAVDGEQLMLCDYGNRKVHISSVYRGYVEKHVGRIEFLRALPQSSKWFVYMQFSAYQGVYQRGKPWGQVTLGEITSNYNRITGRHVLLPPQRLLVTTLGKGTVGINNNDITRDYANCAARVAFPLGTNDERVLAPQTIHFKGEVITPSPHCYLPVLNINSQYHGTFPSENTAMLVLEAILSIDTLANAVNGARGGKSAYTVTDTFNKLQYSFNSAKYETFACAQTPSIRWILMPFLVVIDGEVLLAVRTEVISSSITENAVGDTVNNIIDLYRPIGHPMLRDMSDSDIFVTLV